MEFFKKKSLGNSLVVQWLGLQASTAAGVDSTPVLRAKILKPVALLKA